MFRTNKITTKIAIRKDKKNKQGFVPVVIQLSTGKEVTRIPLGFTIKEIDFDHVNQNILSSHNESRLYNSIIQKAKYRITETLPHYQEIVDSCVDCSYTELFKHLYNNLDQDINEAKENLVKKHGLQFTIKEHIFRQPRAPLTVHVPINRYVEARELLNNFIRGERDTRIETLLRNPDTEEIVEKNEMFHEAWKKYLHYCNLEKRASTASKVQNNFDILKTYTDKQSIPLNYDSFTEEFGTLFKHYLLKEHYNRNTKKKGVSNGTVHNIQKSISTFLNWSFKKGYNKNLDFKKWDTKKPKTHLHYLNVTQLHELYRYDLSPGGSLDKSRDLWCFSAFTGMRISDVENWLPSNAKDGMIRYRSIKARKDCMVGLNEVSDAILKKYDGILPRQNDALVNRNIKEVLTKMGYDKIFVNRILCYGTEDRLTVIPLSQAITFHSARRSFINMMISKGVSIIPLSSMVGNDVNSLMVYYKADGTQIKKIMDDIDLFG